MSRQSLHGSRTNLVRTLDASRVDHVTYRSSRRSVLKSNSPCPEASSPRADPSAECITDAGEPLMGELRDGALLDPNASEDWQRTNLRRPSPAALSCMTASPVVPDPA